MAILVALIFKDPVVEEVKVSEDDDSVGKNTDIYVAARGLINTRYI